MFLLLSMSTPPTPKRPQRFIDAAAKATFIAVLVRGARREDAADEAGFSLMGFYNARSRDPAFAAAWAEALALPPAADRRTQAYEARDAAAAAQARGEVRIASANRRLYQRRRRRNVRFTEVRRETFLTHFATDCDTAAAAAAAGVSVSTVSYHVRKDPAFAEAYRDALALGYANLEAEVVRQRIAAQAKLRAAIEASGERAVPQVEADAGAEFDRIMKLLARHDRKPRRVERGFKPGGRRQARTFDQAIKELDKKLRALGLRTDRPVPPAIDARD